MSVQHIMFVKFFHIPIIPTQVYCPKNNHNINHIIKNNHNHNNSHLPLTNLLSSSETKSSNLSLTSNLNFSECSFSLLEISSSRIYHHVSSSLKFSLIFMILFNVMFLHQPLQSVLIDRFWQIIYWQILPFFY